MESMRISAVGKTSFVFVGQVGNLPPIENRRVTELSKASTRRLTIGGRLSTCPTNGSGGNGSGGNGLGANAVKAKGITLVELLVVVAIISLMVGISFPALRASIRFA
jgi:prepilin-type N-terminal cleavage/methylation domain-containing protein